jgi:WW domain-containing oxidoreductase
MTMSLLSRIKRPGPSGFGYASTAEDVTRGLDLTGKTILLTGCNSGLGLETLRVLSMRGARVLGAARSLDKARQAIDAAAARATPLACDLAEPASVRACVAEVEKLGVELDAIICNAGIMALPELTLAHGYEAQFFTNHIGHFLLVTGLLSKLAPAGRVVMVSSEAHRGAPRAGIEFDNLKGERSYRAWPAYGQSKLANLLFARELSGRLPGPRQLANAIHPGLVATNLFRDMPKLMQVGLDALRPLALKSIPQGAATQCYVATHPTLAENGEYFSDCNLKRSTRAGSDRGLARQLWDVSERIAREV